MNEYKYHYFFTSFDIETFEIEDFKYNFVNITAFRLVDLSDIGVKELVKDMERYHYSQNITIFDTNRYIKVGVRVSACDTNLSESGLPKVVKLVETRLDNGCCGEIIWDKECVTVLCLCGLSVGDTGRDAFCKKS